FRHRASLKLNAILAVAVGALVLHKLNSVSTTTSIPVDRGKPTNEVGSRKMMKRTPTFPEQPKSPQYADITSASNRRQMIIDQLRAMGVPNEVLGRVARVDFEVE